MHLNDTYLRNVFVKATYNRAKTGGEFGESFLAVHLNAEVKVWRQSLTVLLPHSFAFMNYEVWKWNNYHNSLIIDLNVKFSWHQSG